MAYNRIRYIAEDLLLTHNLYTMSNTHELVKTPAEYEKQFGLNAMTNEEFLSHLCNFSSFGALSQMALTHVIQCGLEDCLAQKEAYLEKHQKDLDENKVSLVHAPSWVGVMEEIQEKFNAKYKS